MADNVTYTSTNPAGPPNATVQKTDEVSGAHVPYAKLLDGTDGGTAAIAAGSGVAAGALRVVQATDGTAPLPSGAATSAKQDTEITALQAIQTAVETLDNAVGGSELQVDVVSSALPSGAATSAKQPALGTAGSPSTDVISVQGVASGTALPVSAAALPLPSGAATLAEQQTQTASLSVLDDWDESDRAKVNPIVGQAGVQGGSGGVSALTQRGVLATDVGLPAGTNNIGDVDVLTVPADPFGANADAASATGSISAKLRFIASTGIPVTGSVTVSTHAVTQSGTWTVVCGGDVAHDSPDSGSPVKLGAKAKSALNGITLVAADDRSDIFCDLDGALITRPHCPMGDIVSGVASNTDGASTEVIAAAAAGIKQYLTSVTLANMSSTNIYVEIKSGTTVKWRFPVPANGGVTHNFNPPLPPNAAAEAWNMDGSAAVTTLYGSFLGFKSKV